MANFRFNFFTGNFDRVTTRLSDDEIDRILNCLVLSSRNELGNKQFFFDPVACKYTEAPPQLTVDEDGKIVTSCED